MAFQSNANWPSFWKYTSYIVNKFEYVWVDPCAVRSNLMRFEHVKGGGLGPPYGGNPPVNRQTDRHT